MFFWHKYDHQAEGIRWGVVSALTQPAIRWRLWICCRAEQSEWVVTSASAWSERGKIERGLTNGSRSFKELDQSQPSIVGPASGRSVCPPDLATHWAPGEQGRNNNNSNTNPFSMSVEKNGDSYEDKTVGQDAWHIQEQSIEGARQWGDKSNLPQQQQPLLLCT